MGTTTTTTTFYLTDLAVRGRGVTRCSPLRNSSTKTDIYQSLLKPISRVPRSGNDVNLGRNGRKSRRRRRKRKRGWRELRGGGRDYEGVGNVGDRAHRLKTGKSGGRSKYLKRRGRGRGRGRGEE